MEAVLAQVFKEKKDDEFVGGLPFYGRKLLGNSVGIGIFLSILYILYALCCLPAQGFNVVSSVGRMAEILTGKTIAVDSVFYYVAGAAIIVLTSVIAFGGIKKVSKWTDMMVPVMAVLYILVVFILILLNVGQIPYFFGAVFGGAFKPQAFFGGAMGTVLAQGVKRGLMSNEAGQGTITMSAAAADAKHPCEQGILASLGVFLGYYCDLYSYRFVVVMAHCWTGEGAKAWAALDKLPKFTESIAVLTPGTSMNAVMTFLVTLCFGLFAFTCLLGMISFSEIAANRIRKDAICINIVRCIALFVAAFGILYAGFPPHTEDFQETGGKALKKELVIVIDFGGQYNQLVARRVRECNVYCEIYSYKTDLEKIKAMNPKGIILDRWTKQLL